MRRETFYRIYSVTQEAPALRGAKPMKQSPELRGVIGGLVRGALNDMFFQRRFLRISEYIPFTDVSS
jgi:hypothetical protein